MRIFSMFGHKRCCTMVFSPADAGANRAWAGFDENETHLNATITDLAMSGSHPTLQVRAQDGMNWTVELGRRARARDAGLTDRQASPGDRVSIVGHQATGFGERRIKAVRLSIGGRDFELYPAACLES